ncbi:HlyD family type I secretion periplasmic adaptor subunit [Microvirga sp. ACRRW]|uniref:HlyD family type I secretion periplasmic adaptor subunit n=1 Tax=Microvirga sp. ACRRW TaxID=2918205 RepID=UPI001EF5FF91|nr:HlyD family type I secretion periplasmic adaptor subunit [Microvirga sp. ACRRW]MCG7394902.1 HlyD family type I secretion periplasmic adaptor subunit [Microvirga sp. ACRRW]
MAKTSPVIDLSDVLPQPPPTPFRRIRGLAGTAFGLIIVFIGGFGVWSVSAPLESAAIAAGSVEVETSRKTVQHLEGGIVSRILVKDGDAVRAGQPLIELDDTKARASAQALVGQLREAQAREARLLAERDHRDSIQFPQPLLQAAEKDPAVAEVLAGQRRIFSSRLQLHNSQLAVLVQRQQQISRQMIGLRYQVNAAEKRAEIIKREMDSIAPLVAKGVIAQPRKLQLEREQAEIEGRRGQAQEEMARAEQGVGEANAQILKLRSDREAEIAQSLREAQALVFQLAERFEAAQDILARTQVRAPEDGTVTELRIRTPGGVVMEGQPLLDLVPEHDRLIVTAQVRPDDIDVVHPGLQAQVRLLPYKHRRVPPVEGTLVYVAADRMVEKTTERSYYTARIRLDEASLAALPGVEVMAGMPVEVLIKTGKFTVAGYMMRPVTNSFNRAFRED